MRLTATFFALLLFALTLVAEAGCRRPAAGDTLLAAPSAAHAVRMSMARMAASQASQVAQASQVSMLRVSASPASAAQAGDSGPVFTFCHPRAEQLGQVRMSAAAAQVAFDAGANNDDRTEMMALEVESPTTALLPHPIAQARPAVLPMPVPEDLLRPPRALRA